MALDVLRRTGYAPLGAGLTSADTKTLYLNMTKEELVLGVVLKGAFFTAANTNFLSFINNVYTNNDGFLMRRRCKRA